MNNFPTTSPELLAEIALHGSRVLIKGIQTTADDKLNWNPVEGSKARTIYDQVFECAMACRRSAARLKGEDPGTPPEPTAYASKDEAIADIEDGAKTLSDTIRGMSLEELQEEIETPFGKWKKVNSAIFPVANMYYHWGVINSYQLMYGDEEFSFDPNMALA